MMGRIISKSEWGSPLCAKVRAEEMKRREQEPQTNLMGMRVKKKEKPRSERIHCEKEKPENLVHYITITELSRETKLCQQVLRKVLKQYNVTLNSKRSPVGGYLWDKAEALEAVRKYKYE